MPEYSKDRGCYLFGMGYSSRLVNVLGGILKGLVSRGSIHLAGFILAQDAGFSP